MTTNQTIDGVRRELLEKALRDANTIRFPTDKHVTELRALLDAPAALGEIDLTPKRLAHAESVIEQQNNLIASLRAELVESYRIDRKTQGEPVAAKSQCQACQGRGSLKDADGMDKGYCTPCDGSGKASALSADELRFLETIALFPGCKLNGGIAWDEEGNSLWGRLEALGLIECVGGYKWKLSFNAVELGVKAYLGSTRPTHASPPPGSEPSGTHHDNDGLDEMRKP